MSAVLGNMAVSSFRKQFDVRADIRQDGRLQEKRLHSFVLTKQFAAR